MFWSEATLSQFFTSLSSSFITIRLPCLKSCFYPKWCTARYRSLERVCHLSHRCRQTPTMFPNDTTDISFCCFGLYSFYTLWQVRQDCRSSPVLNTKPPAISYVYLTLSLPILAAFPETPKKYRNQLGWSLEKHWKLFSGCSFLQVTSLPSKMLT